MIELTERLTGEKAYIDPAAVDAVLLAGADDEDRHAMVYLTCGLDL